MKIDVYYDITCAHCGRSRSTDFYKGMVNQKEHLRKAAQKEGWGQEKKTKLPICPICYLSVLKINNSQNKS